MRVFELNLHLVADRGRESEIANRFEARLLANAARAFGARWRGLQSAAEDSDGPPRPDPRAFFDPVLAGEGGLSVVVARPEDCAVQSLRAALHRTLSSRTTNPPRLLTPDGESVRTGALRSALEQLPGGAVADPFRGTGNAGLQVVSLLGVPGSAMPDALFETTSAIVRSPLGRSARRWVLVVEELYAEQLGRWSQPDLFGVVEILRAPSRSGVRIAMGGEAGALDLRVELWSELFSLYAGVGQRGLARSGPDRLARDIATLERAVDDSLDELGLEVGFASTRRSSAVPPAVEELIEAVRAHEAGDSERDAFIDWSLRTLEDLRDQAPAEAREVAELLAALADSRPDERVPVPEDAVFVETIGRPSPVAGS